MSFKGMFGLATDDVDDDDLEYDETDDTQDEVDDTPTDTQDEVTPNFSPTARPVMPQPATITPFSAGQAQGVLGTFMPRTVDDCAEIVESMRNNVPVIVNFSKAKPADRYYIRLFLFGVMAGLKGQSKSVSDDVRIFVPGNYKILDTPMKKRGAQFPFA